MESLYSLLMRLPKLVAQVFDNVLSHSAADLVSSAILAVALGAIGLMAARRLKS